MKLRGATLGAVEVPVRELSDGERLQVLVRPLSRLLAQVAVHDAFLPDPVRRASLDVEAVIDEWAPA